MHLNGILDENIYMLLGFVAQRECVKVCRLKKSLYGLKQAPRAWFGRLASLIPEFDLGHTHKDHSLF